MPLALTLALLSGQLVVIPFQGEQVSLQVEPQHNVRLGPELFDVSLSAGWHRLTEQDAKQLPGPLLVIGNSAVNALDGDAVVVGHRGVKVKGPGSYSVFSVEPFLARFPAMRLRMLFEGGASIFAAQASEFLLMPDHHRWVRVVGLDPTARYEVSIAGKRGVQQVLVASDLEVPPERDQAPGDAAWTASRLVLRGGGKATLPATRQIAITQLGVPALIDQKLSAPLEVTVRLVKPGKGELGPPRTVIIGQSQDELLLAARKLLDLHQWGSAKSLTGQCVREHPENAECHLLHARGVGLGGDLPNAISEGCLAIRLGAGTPVATEARELLGAHATQCR